VQTRTLRQRVHAQYFRRGLLKVLGVLRFPGRVEESEQQQARRELRRRRKQERQNRVKGRYENSTT
jgi:hypothetical protein